MKHVLAVVMVVSLSGCHTFMKMKPDYAELPVDTLREIAVQIEQAVKDGEREPQIEDRGGVVLGTDTIKQAIRTRAARAHLVEAFLLTGHAWERRNGMMEILRTSEYKKSGTSRDRDRNAMVVMGEGADRWALYEGIIDAGNFPSKSLGAVQRIFFEARVQVMADGIKYEDESGNVAYKGGQPPAAPAP
ncbi:MAG: hypothetical protein IT365_11440 [Candidatus Hydrogenedentes bacterium]|nr:hypothetical protein [Candidatus Hydrogenedentota bacterium]